MSVSVSGWAMRRLTAVLVSVPAGVAVLAVSEAVRLSVAGLVPVTAPDVEHE